MDRKDIALLLLAAFLLLVIGVLINSFQLWSISGNYTIPWFCSALGTGLCLISITSLLTQSSPSSIPMSRAAVVIIGSSVCIGIGMVIDGFVYTHTYDWISSIGEWFGFTLILIIMFWLPKIKNKTKSD
jgi:MFS family permease